jgi:hypothetical protein
MTKEYFETVVGSRNTQYYIAIFEAFQSAGGKIRLTWNWPAFLFNFAWALYRKMYLSTLILLGIGFFGSIFEESGSPVISLLISVSTLISFGMFANFLYFRKAITLVTGAEIAFSEQSARMEYLGRKGGVHAWVPRVFGSMVLAGIIVAIAVPAITRIREADHAHPATATTPRSVWDEFEGKSKSPVPIKGFIEHGDPGVVMPLDVKDKLTGRVSIARDGLLAGNIYNGTPDWTVREVVINLMEPNWLNRSLDADKRRIAAPRMEKYRVQVHIPPFSNQNFSVSVNWRQDEKFEWNIHQARGVMN